MLTSFRRFVVTTLLAPLAACAGAPGVLPPNEAAHISKVQVSLAPNLSSQRFAEMLQAKATQHASRFGRDGAAKELRIVVNRHSYKNPAMSLLIGDANYAGGRVAVVDAASGKVQGEADAGAIDNLAINGIAGAIMAAAQDKQKVDERLADDFAKNALRVAYGAARANEAFSRPDPAPAVIAPAPRPAGKPQPTSKPIGTPVAAAGGDRTAMAEVQVTAAR